MPYFRAQATISLRLVARLDAPKPDLAKQAHAGGGEFGKVALDHALLEHGRAGHDLDACGPEICVGPLCSDRQRLEADDVARAARQVNLARRDHGRDPAV